MGQVSLPTVDDLKAAMNLIDYIRDTCDEGLVFRPIDLQRLIVVAYGDCSFCNCPDLMSQMGALVVVTTSEALNGEAQGNVVDWRSCRTKRQVRATLAGEANAADHASDRGFWVASALTEILTGKSALDLKDDERIPTFPVTDCKSLFDALQKENPQVEDKRTLIDLLRLARTVSSDAVRWVPTEYMWADGLTKRDKHLRRRFLEWLGNIRVRLKE